MTTTKSLIKNNTFYDSLTLMRISKNASELKEIIQAVTVMGSEINKRMLDDVGLLTDNIKHATTNDVIISVSGKTNSAVESALEAIEKMLVDVNPPRITESVPRTIEAALERLPDANLALISVPGPFAKLEAEKALKRGLNVMLFSDGVSIADELELKKEAEKKDLLMMGPGCGTAIINGIGLGFANVVQKGQVGIVGAAGTGIQQVTTLIHQKGYGISNAIGTGGRDLSNDIGGIMMHKGIKILENDNDTKVIVLISKPPDPKIERTILEKSYTKPVIFCFIGGESPEPSRTINAPIIVTVHTLEEAAIAAIALVKKEKWSKIIFSRPMEEVMRIAEREWLKLNPQQKYVRGLYSGGTLCSESFIILSRLLVNVYSNVTKSKFELKDVRNSQKHTCLDMGEEEFTTGRAHPMIDPLLRQQRIVSEAKDQECAVILLDIVLGYGSHIDPAGELVNSIRDAKALCEKEGRYLSVVASVTGTDKDPQGLKNQMDKLISIGVVLMESNAQAARMAALIVTRGSTMQILERS